MSKHKELAVDYFSRHKLSNECHITSDNRVFHTKGGAESFSSTLKDYKINSFTRKSLESNNDSEAELLEQKVKDLEALELVKENYKSMKDLVKFFQIEVTDQKADTLIEALTEYKLKIQA